MRLMIVDGCRCERRRRWTRCRLPSAGTGDCATRVMADMDSSHCFDESVETDSVEESGW